MKEFDEDDNLVEFLKFRDPDEGRPENDTQPSAVQQKPRRKWLWMAGIAMALLIAAIATYIITKPTATNTAESSAFEPEATQSAPPAPHPLRSTISALTEPGITIIDTMVNDIPLRIYVTTGLTPHLEIGYDCLSDTINNVMFFQAADVRADNKKIVGAFVLQGTPKSWGLSKKGFCSIINDSITIGVADNSPLFEQATEVGGDFFRQYPLVSNNTICENELKNKATRRALCDIEGHVAVVTTLDSRESLHDFSQALVDIGTSNAIYLVGSNAIGFVQGNSGKIGVWSARKFRNASFIVWRSK